MTVRNATSDVWWSPEHILPRAAMTFDSRGAKSFFAHRRILVTGAAGSIGQAVTQHLCRCAPESLILFDHNETALVHLAEQATEEKVPIHPVLGDIAVRDCVEEVFDRYRPEFVIHTAAYKQLPFLEGQEREATRVNVLGTELLAEVADAREVTGFMFLSTDKAVEPSSVLGRTKALAERKLFTIRNKKPWFSAVRFGNVYGSRGSAVEVFVRQIEKGGPVTVTDPRMNRFFMTLDEAAGFVLASMTRSQGGEIFVPKLGEPIPVVELAHRLIRAAGLEPEVDIPIRVTGRRPGEKLSEVLLGEGEVAEATDHPSILRIRVKL